MPGHLSESELVRTFTGLVVESLAVTQDMGAATVDCRRCGEALASGDRATVALSCYEDYSWEVAGVYCPGHGIARVADAMDVRAEQQAVVRAVLEETGYLPPNGKYEADALTLGAVEIADYSPTADGY
ncbi:MAG: hypothetical protein V5A28_00810 [Haloarculaceae archaeon]